MKKLIALLMACAMLFSLAACQVVDKDGMVYHDPTQPAEQVDTEETTPSEPEGEEVDVEPVGGWTTFGEEELPQEAVDALNRALEGMEGAKVEPLRLLATQVVAGTNYALLCRVTGVYPDAVPTCQIVYVYEGLDGEAEVLRMQSLVDIGEEEAEGSWTEEVSDESNQAGIAALELAVGELTGAAYQPIVTVGMQVVGGINYVVLCSVTPVVPDGQPEYCLVTVYQDLEGNAELTEVAELDYDAQEPGVQETQAADGYELTLQTWQQLPEEEKDATALLEAGVSPLCLEEADPTQTVGYALYDFDNDGSEELVFGYIPEDETHDARILGLYTMVNGEIQCLFTSQAEDNLYITNLTEGEDYAFYRLRHTEEGKEEYTAYVLLDGELLVSQLVTGDRSDSGSWQMGSGDEELTAIDEETGKAIIDSAENNQVRLPMTPLDTRG